MPRGAVVCVGRVAAELGVRRFDLLVLDSQPLGTPMWLCLPYTVALIFFGGKGPLGVLWSSC